MRASEIMSTNVRTVPSSMRASDAWNLMQGEHIHHLVVMAGSDVEGIFSARDAGGRGGASLRKTSTIADLMTAPVVTVGPADTARKIANVMRGRSIGCVPVVDGRRVVGIVTVSDMLEMLGRGVDRPSPPERPGLHHRVPHRKIKGGARAW